MKKVNVTTLFFIVLSLFFQSCDNADDELPVLLSEPELTNGFSFKKDGIVYTYSNNSFSVSGYDAVEINSNSTILNVVINNGITYKVSQIKNAAFKNCTLLKSIFIPENIEKIGDEAFTDCPQLSVFKIDSLNIKYSAYDNILYNKEMTHLILCPTNHQTYDFPKYVKCIDKAAFKKCTYITNLVLPNGIVKIEPSAFEGCTSLKSITLPTSCVTISERAFYDCPLTSLTIPENVREIGRLAFWNIGTSNVTCLATTPPLLDNGGFSFKSYGTLHILKGYYEKYRYTAWYAFTIVEDAQK